MLWKVSSQFFDFLALGRNFFVLVFIGILVWKFYNFVKFSNSKRVAQKGKIFDLLIIGFLAFLTILYFWRIVSNSPLHQGSIGGDIDLFFPLRYFAAVTLRRGIIPLWNPYIFSGLPFLADSQAAVFHPLNLILSLFVRNNSLSYKAVELIVVFHFFLAGLFIYLYTRNLGLSRFGALISSIIFMFSADLVTRIIHLPILAVVVWLPLIFLFIDKAFLEKKPAFALLASLFLAISILGGHLQMVLFVFYATLAYGLFRIYFLAKDEPDFKVGRQIFLLGLIFILALGLSAAQILPTMEILPQSVRSIDLSYHLTTDFSMEFQNLIMFFLPNFFGGNPGRYWGPWSYWWEMSGYLGIFPLVLILFSLVFIKKREVRFFGILGLVSLLLAFGGHTFLHPLMYLFLPGYSLNRAPSRLLFLLTFSGAILAGFGADLFIGILSEDLKKFALKVSRLSFYLVVGALPIVLIFYLVLAGSINTARFEIFSHIVNNWNLLLLLLLLSGGLIALRLKEAVNIGLVKFLIIGLILFDLFSFGWKWYIEEKKPEEYYPENEIVRFLRQDKGYFRVANDWVLPENAGAAYSIFTTSGSSPLSLKQYQEFAHREDLLNVKYVLTKKNLPDENYRLVFQSGEDKVFQRKDYLPRAFLVKRARVVLDSGETTRILDSNQFNPREEVIINEEISQKLLKPVSDSRGRVRIEEYYPNEIRLRASLQSPGWLVLSEIYYPGWLVYLDGKPDKVYRANNLLRAVYLPGGNHKVRMVFDPPSYRWGVRVSLLTLGVMIIFLCAHLLRPKEGRLS